MTVISQLGRLETSGLIRLAQVEPDLEYLFRHSLVQEAAYHSLLAADQKRLHLAVGDGTTLRQPLGRAGGHAGPPL
jgi:predicted ATPase